MNDDDYTFLRSTVRMLALQLNTLTAHVGELAAISRSQTASNRLSAHYQKIEEELLTLSKSILRVVDSLPPEEPSRERISGNGQ